MAMEHWIVKLDEFLRLSDRELLTHAGTVSHETAVAKALQEYERYMAIENQKPQPVDAHFEEAVSKAKRLDGNTSNKRGRESS